METQSNKSSSKEKKLKRKELLERKKAVDEMIKKAASVKDHLASFPPFCHYQRNGVSVYLESGNGDQLSSSAKKFIQNLLKLNMEGPYGEEWPTEEKVKRREMVNSEARYIFIKQKSGERSAIDEQMNGSDRLVGFVHYRFVVEEDLPVVYVYELQLESSVKGKGLGKFLMQLVELIARKNEMRAVMLTVQKVNLVAMNFYTNKLRYVMSSISPTRVNIQIGAETNYEIYCKTFDSEAKATLE
ncbi:hypothetical protein LUZ60_001322 [Juncus effusus]|nr:hypothetical protein LUZ60_001322 [Juncus effusus]